MRTLSGSGFRGALRETAEDPSVPDLVVRYGGPVANGLLDSRCLVFRTHEVRGVIGYRESWGCAVALGDPVCAPHDVPRMAASFRAECARRGMSTVYAAASAEFAAVLSARGGAALEFGTTSVVDPRRDPQSGARGRELRKKVARASREGVVTHEYRPDRAGRDLALERALEDVVARWLRARRGPQIYVARVRLFEPRFAGRRWWYARAGEHVVGVLTLLRMESRGGYLFEHLLAAPGAPIGTTELLAAGALATLAAEGCRFATFGPAPSRELGAARNLGSGSESLARAVFSSASEVFHFDGRSRYQRKFQPERVEPSFLVFDPPRLGVRDVVGLIRAFNVFGPC